MLVSDSSPSGDHTMMKPPAPSLTMAKLATGGSAMPSAVHGACPVPEKLCAHALAVSPISCHATTAPPVPPATTNGEACDTTRCDRRTPPAPQPAATPPAESTRL